MLMPATVSFSLKQARRLALVAQGFNGRQPPAVKAAHVNRLIERLGLLQIDSVNAVVRSHYLPLFSRLGSYSSDLLDQAAWSSGDVVRFLNTGDMKRRCCRCRCIR
jgi:uncharacterized protein YcaQ